VAEAADFGKPKNSRSNQNKSMKTISMLEIVYSRKSNLCKPGMVLALVLLTAFRPHAAMIDFEAINGVTPVEGGTISNQFQAHFGISFRRVSSALKFPVIAQFGSPRAAFERDGGADDKLAVTNKSDYGEFFLTDDPESDTSGSGVILDFSAPVSQASGYIFDIDGKEKVTVVAYSDTNGVNQLDAQFFAGGMPGTGDGQAALWTFIRPTKDVRRIDIVTSGGGVGYDNFASDYLPPAQTPATLGIQIYPGLTIQGDVGRPYRIDYTDNLNSTNWHTLTNLFLPASPYLFYDSSPASQARRFYRAVGIP
jgi:hypothetical protein